jgi:glutamate dehydrogenase
MAAQWIPETKINDQIEWFYNDLGIDDEYFQKESAEVISNHIASLYAAQVAAVAREGTRDAIGLDMEAADHAIYIDTSEPGKGRSYRYEERLESKYIDGLIGNKRFRVEAFCSPNNLTRAPPSQPTMRCYFVYQCQFEEPNPSNPQETKLDIIGDKMFLAKASHTTRTTYQEIMKAAVTRTGPVIKDFDVEGGSEPEKRIVIAFRQRTAPGIFSALSDLYHYYDVISPKKYVDQFSNGITIISLNLKVKDNKNQNYEAKARSVEWSCQQISKEISLLYCIPRNKFQLLFANGRLSLQETIYGHCVWVFVQHFLDRLGKFPFLDVDAVDRS